LSNIFLCKKCSNKFLEETLFKDELHWNFINLFFK
jgi:hypothetical protein